MKTKRSLSKMYKLRRYQSLAKTYSPNYYYTQFFSVEIMERRVSSISWIDPSSLLTTGQAAPQLMSPVWEMGHSPLPASSPPIRGSAFTVVPLPRPSCSTLHAPSPATFSLWTPPEFYTTECLLPSSEPPCSSLIPTQLVTCLSACLSLSVSCSSVCSLSTCLSVVFLSV